MVIHPLAIQIEKAGDVEGRVAGAVLGELVAPEVGVGGALRDPEPGVGGV
jgi:hypothetical protein